MEVDTLFVLVRVSLFIRANMAYPLNVTQWKKHSDTHSGNRKEPLGDKIVLHFALMLNDHSNDFGKLIPLNRCLLGIYIL